MSSESDVHTPMAYIAFDPGVHTGWATFDVYGQSIGNGYCTDPFELYEFLDDLPTTHLKVCIIEEYKIRPNKQSTHAWSDVPTLRVIGAIEYWAYCNDIKTHFQPPAVKTMGYKYMGGGPTRHKILSHQLDALAHGVYYLQVHHIRKPVIPDVKLTSSQ